MNKGVILLVLFTVLCFPALGQEVAEDVFLNTEPIEFINYEGPYDVINTLEQIRGIGEILGQDVKPDVSLSALYGPYRIIHSYQPEIEEGLDGDILIMGSASQVDSVSNLRYIIGGYLESAYGYERERAYTIAIFITYYNALYYQKIDHYSSLYKEGVLDNLEPDQCGLARVWSDWPGKARIVIPLRAPGYSESPAIDSSLISSDEVVEVMQEEEDMRIEERKEMVEIREEENRAEEEAMEEKGQELAERESALIEMADELEEKEEPLTEEEEEQLEEIKEEQQQVQEEIEELEEAKEELEDKTEEVLDMRDDIASDENKVISEGDPEVEKKESVFVSPEDESAVPLFFFNQTGIEEGYAFGLISLYDLTSGTKEKESTATTIYGRTHREFAGGFLAIAKDRKSGMVLPMIIDRENLAISLKGEEEIFPGTQVEIDKSNQIYMVYKDGSQWRLGRFDKDLQLTGASSEAVEPMTDILFYNGKLFVQNTEGAVLELNSDNLTVEKELE
ncbi:MAG: P83/100 family protein [Spirochaetales bacterium]|nr:P83/100 family protein [Spirochaetales bacterium]